MLYYSLRMCNEEHYIILCCRVAEIAGHKKHPITSFSYMFVNFLKT